MTPEEFNQTKAELLALALDKTNTDEWLWECFPKAEPEYSYKYAGYDFYIFIDGTSFVRVNEAEDFFLSSPENNYNLELGLELYKAIEEQYDRQHDAEAAKKRDRDATWLKRILSDLS